MERNITINDLLPDRINKLSSSLIPPGDTSNHRVVQDMMTELINDLGKRSAEAQGLSKAITVAEKVRISLSHIVYLLKDPKGDGGKGEVIGMLRVGRKHLFLFDERDQLREVDPFCVLDFYVAPVHRRHGYGRLLYDFMLQDLELTVHDLPVDGPSSNMERFLAKNYNLDDMVRQNNNFYVSPFFFIEHTGDNNGATASSNARAATPGTSSGGPTGRYTARRPTSNIASIIHGGASREQYPGLTMAQRNARAMNAALAAVGRQWEREEEEAARGLAAGSAYGGASTSADSAANMRCFHARMQAERELEPTSAYELEPSHSRPASLPVVPPTAPPALDSDDDSHHDSHHHSDDDDDEAVAAAGASPAERRRSQLTDRGYFDVKYYHSKLW